MTERYSVAVITGGASGLGEGATKHFLANNFKVAILDINEDKAHEFIQSLPKAHQERTIFIKTNVTNEDQIEAAIDKAIQTFGQIHVVVNSAGIGYAELTYSKRRGVASSKKLIKNLGVNVVGTFNVCKHAANRMKAQPVISDTQDRGVLINISSIMGIEATSGFVSYAITKGAVIGMTLPMARDLGKYKIRVLTVAPGLIQTPMNKNSPPDSFERNIKEAALGRLSNPLEFGRFVYNVSHSSFLNGEVIRFDGAYRTPKI